MKKDIRLSLIRLTGILLSFGIQVMLIKFIGASEYGVYVLFTTWSAILSQVLIFGYDRMMVKELSLLFLQNEMGKFRYALDKVLYIILLNCILFSLLVLAMPLPILKSTFFSQDLLRSTWILIGIGAAAFTGFQITGKILISVQRIELSFVRSEVVYKLIFILAVAVLYLLFKAQMGLNIIVAGAVLSYALTILLLLIRDKKRLRCYLRIKKEGVMLGRENYIFFFSTFNYFLISQLDKIQLGRMTDMQTLGIYGLAATLCTMTSFSIVGYSRLIPKISHYLSNNQVAELEAEFKQVVRNAVIIALPIMMFLFVFAEDVLLFFGAQYVKAANVLRILLCGQMVYYFTGPNGNLLNNGRYAKVDLLNSIGTLLLTIALNLIGYRIFGFIGVAIGTSVGMTISNLLKVIEVKYFMKLFPYDLENLFLTFIAFASFGFIKIICFTSGYLLLDLIANFAMGTMMAVVVASLFYKLRGQPFTGLNNESFFHKLKVFSLKSIYYSRVK